jgi:hypothetical protein
MIVPEVKNLIWACENAINLLDDYSDVIDGDDGRPIPNAAMIVKMELERALKQFTSLHDPDFDDGRTL